MNPPARLARLPGELEDRLRGLDARIARDERFAGVCGFSQTRIERHGAEHRHAELGREMRAAAKPEHLRRHVLDHPDDAHPGLLRHHRRT